MLRVLLFLALVCPLWAELEMARCAICMVTEGAGPEKVFATETCNGKSYSLCNADCQKKFQADPAGWAARADEVAAREGRRDLGQLPEFEVDTLRSRDYQGKVLIIDFWATWCGPCVAEIPEFVELQKQHPDKLQVIGFSYDQDPEKHKEFLTKLNYPSVLASEAKPFLKAVTEQIGPIKGIPVTILVDKTGRIVFRQSGVVGDDFRSTLKELLQ